MASSERLTALIAEAQIHGYQLRVSEEPDESGLYLAGLARRKPAQHTGSGHSFDGKSREEAAENAVAWAARHPA